MTDDSIADSKPGIYLILHSAELAVRPLNGERFMKALSRFCRRVEEREWSLKRPLIVAEFRKLTSGLRGTHGR